MAAAYRHADAGEPAPGELVAISYIDRFGAQAVYGRPLGAGEMRRMSLVENIVNAYRARERSDNWAAWAKEHPRDSELLAQAAKAADYGE
jgi:hypothetical protein